VEDSLILDKLVGYYDEYYDNTAETRRQAERDRDFYDSKQLTDQEYSNLTKRGQSPSVNNRIKPKVDSQLGIERKTRTDPKAFPRTREHEIDAEAATDALRYVMQNTDFDQTRSHVYENILIEGVGGCTVDVKAKGDSFEIEIDEIAWDRIFYDIHSRKRDFSDAKYRGISIWMDEKDAIDFLPGGKQIIENALSSNEEISDTNSDKPTNKWTDSNRKRVRINLIYYQEKRIWHYAFYTKGGLLSKPAKSPYIDEDGMPECPIILQSAFIDREGARYGSVRQLISIQEGINKRESKAIHLFSVRQTFAEEGAVEDVQEMKREMSKPDGHITTRPGSEFGKHFGIIPTSDMGEAQFRMLRESKDDIDAVGANPELSGESNATSGRDFIARQEAGINEQGVLIDSLKSFGIRVYRQAWNRIRQYWTEERWIRVTDNPDNIKWVGLNQPVTIEDQLNEEFGELPPEYANDPRLSVQVGVRNDLANLDVDIIIEDTPDVTTIQQEQFDLVAKLSEAYPEKVPIKSLVALSSLRNKKEFMDEIQGDDEQKAALAEEQQQAKQIEQETIIGEIENTAADTEKKRAEALKTMVDAQTPEQTNHVRQ